jgi:hypothetical protein
MTWERGWVPILIAAALSVPLWWVLIRVFGVALSMGIDKLLKAV